MNWEHWEDDREPWRFNRKRGMIKNDPTKHYPNKQEGKLLRRIMSETGLTEEQVRSHKKYRKMLTDAQKSGQKEKGWSPFHLRVMEKVFKRLLKKVCKELGLAKEHPKTITRIMELNNERNKSGVYSSLQVSENEMKHMINAYLKGK